MTRQRQQGLEVVRQLVETALVPGPASRNEESAPAAGGTDVDTGDWLSYGLLSYTQLGQPFRVKDGPGAAVGATVSPYATAGMALWLKADAGVYQDSGLITPAALDGDPVGGWFDWSPFGHHVSQSTSTKRPALKLNQVNGKPVLRFDGVDDFLSGSFTDDLRAISSGGTVLMVLSRVRTAALKTAWDPGGTGVGAGLLFYSDHSTGDQERALYGISGPSTTQTGFDTAAAYHLTGWEWDATGMALYENGVSRASLATAPTIDLSARTTHYLGSQGGTQRYHDADIAELLVFSRRLLAAERQNLERNYFGPRYGFAVA